jgi:RHS repeat-associated protein
MKPTLLPLLAAIALSPIGFGQITVAFPSTGQATATNPLQDAHWRIVGNSLLGEPGSGAAAVVTSLPNGWITPDPGTHWISVQPDQTNATRPGTCCKGDSQYEVSFEVADPNNAFMVMKVAGDEDMNVFLNGNGSASYGLIYATNKPTYNNAVFVTVRNGATYVDPNGVSHVVQFLQGTNTIHVAVRNQGGGPTGIYLSSQPVSTPPAAAFSDASVSGDNVNATPDPVDSGSGQFYETVTDFQLGGPMALGLERYYGSQLSKGNSKSALGANWMHSYDLQASVSGAKAQVLLFGGRVVTFNNSAGAWQLVSPLNTGYQFATLSGNAGYKFMDPASKRIYTFNSSGALTKNEDRNGNAITVTPGTAGPSKVADGLGRSLTFTYSNGQLTGVTDQAGRALTFTYAGGLLASATDNSKAVTNYAYTTIGSSKALLTQETQPAGNAPVSQTYDANGRVISQTDGNNNTTKVEYGPNGATIITRHRNDDTGSILEIADPAGGVASIAYDSAHRRSSITDKTGGTLQYGYHEPSGYISSITDANGLTTSYSYTPQSQSPFTFYVLSGIAYPDGSSASMTYDADGNLQSVTEADGGMTQYSYDSHGWLTKTTDPMGRVSSRTWNADGTVSSDQDPLGNTTKLEYDAQLKKISKVTDANGNSAGITYDAVGRTTASSPPGIANWTFAYDTDGRRTAITNPMGAKYALTYTPTGKIAATTDPLGNVIRRSYDNFDRLARIVNGAGEAVTYNYDQNGNITSLADNSGPRSSYAYDAEGRLTGMTDATGRTILFGYDRGGRRTSVTYPSGNTVTSTYDAFGRVLTRSNAVGDQYTKTYDPMGRLMSVTGPGGASTSFTRDASGNPTSFTSANGNQWMFGYDGSGRLNSIADPAGNTTKYSYTGTRRTKIDYPLGSATFTFHPSGRPTKIAYSDGTTINRTYNAVGHITGGDGLDVQRNSTGLPTSVNGIAITIDGAGKPTSYTYAAGKVVKYTYDAAGRVSGVADWIGGQVSITYDAASRRMSHTFPNGVAVTYGYDADGYRNSITHGSLGAIQLSFDAAGRTTSADRNLPIAPTLHDSSDPLPAVNLDTMGRVTTEGARTYTWDLATRLTGFADSINSAKITYDALGEINSTTASGAMQKYVFNYTVKYPALQIVRQDGKDFRYYVYMPDGELLYSIDAATGTRHFYHFDEMGNTVFLTDDNGAVTDSYGITPYGEVADHAGATDNPFTWQGQYGAIQEANGLYYLRSRHYDAAGARFLSPDPIMNAEPQTSEPYAYARSNPLMYRDAFGADPNLPSDVADLMNRFLYDLFFNVTDPDFAFLSIAVNLVTAYPDEDFGALLLDAWIILNTPPPDPPAIAAYPPIQTAPQTCGQISCATATDPGSGTTPVAAGAASSVRRNIVAGRGVRLDSNDTSSLVTPDGGSLINEGGTGVVSNDGATGVSLATTGLIGTGVVSNDGATAVSRAATTSLISDKGGGFVPRVNAYTIQSLPAACASPNSPRRTGQ